MHKREKGQVYKGGHGITAKQLNQEELNLQLSPPPSTWRVTYLNPLSNHNMKEFRVFIHSVSIKEIKQIG